MAELQPLHTERCKNTPNHILPEKLVIWACCIRQKCNILNISVDVSIQRIFSTRTSTDVFFFVEGRIKVVLVKSSLTQPFVLDCSLAVAAFVHNQCSLAAHVSEGKTDCSRHRGVAVQVPGQARGSGVPEQGTHPQKRAVHHGWLVCSLLV